METTPDQKHEALIEAIKEKNQILNLRPQMRERIGSNDWEKLNTNEINDTVSLIVSYLNLTGGSIGEFDLYELLQCYFRDEQARIEINECVSESLSRYRRETLDK